MFNTRHQLCHCFKKQNLCITAAYRPVRELIQKERQKDMVILVQKNIASVVFF